MIMSPQSLEVPKIKKNKKNIFFLFLFLFLKLQVTEESNVYHLKKVSFSSGGRAQFKKKITKYINMKIKNVN